MQLDPKADFTAVADGLEPVTVLRAGTGKSRLCVS